MISFVIFIIGLSMFLEPVIEMTITNKTFEEWITSLTIHQMHIANSFVLGGIMLMTASMLVP